MYTTELAIIIYLHDKHTPLQKKSIKSFLVVTEE